MQRWLSGTMLKDLLPFFGSKISIWAPLMNRKKLIFVFVKNVCLHIR